MTYTFYVYKKHFVNLRVYGFSALVVCVEVHEKEDAIR